jgi:hypothetical protein
LEFESLAAAEREAATTMAEIGRDRLPKGDARDVTAEPGKENRQRVLTVTVTMRSTGRPGVAAPAREKGSR